MKKLQYLKTFEGYNNGTDKIQGFYELIERVKEVRKKRNIAQNNLGKLLDEPDDSPNVIDAQKIYDELNVEIRNLEAEIRKYPLSFSKSEITKKEFDNLIYLKNQYAPQSILPRDIWL